VISSRVGVSRRRMSELIHVVGFHPCRSGAGQVADRGGLRPFSWWFRLVLGGRVCGVAVKAERPQAKPRTNGLEGGVVRAMLVEPGRGNVRNQGVGRVLTTVKPR
jgi:hypothetical protein